MASFLIYKQNKKIIFLQTILIKYHALFVIFEKQTAKFELLCYIYIYKTLQPWIQIGPFSLTVLQLARIQKVLSEGIQFLVVFLS